MLKQRPSIAMSEIRVHWPVRIFRHHATLVVTACSAAVLHKARIDPFLPSREFRRRFSLYLAMEVMLVVDMSLIVNTYHFRRTHIQYKVVNVALSRLSVWPATFLLEREQYPMGHVWITVTLVPGRFVSKTQSSRVAG